MKKIVLFIVSALLFASPSHAIDFYWVGGAGSWTDLNHWSSTSGGAPNMSIIPAKEDNVFFDANSGLVNNTIIELPRTSPAYCNNISWAGVTAAVSIIYRGQPLLVYGNMEMAASVRYGTQGISFLGNSAATLKTNGAGRHPASGWYNPITVNKPGGSLTLLDDISIALAVTTIQLVAGSLDMSDHTHAFVNLSGGGNAVRSLDVSNATLNLTGTWDYRGTNQTINTAGSFITAGIFHSNGSTYPKVHITSGVNDMVINNTTFGELTFTNPASGSESVRIGAGNTVDRLEYKGGGALAGAGNVIKDLYIAPSTPGFVFVGNNTITGTLHANTPDCDALGQLRGYTTGATVTFAPGAVADVRNVYMTNLTAAGSITPITVTGADGGGNVGWDFQPSATGTTLYWVGGGGDWNDKSHWSATSGGAGGYCVPFTGDNVVFDANSGFTAGNNTVTATAGSTWCKDMTWTNVPGSPVFENRGVSLFMYGSLILDPTVTINGNIRFRGTEAATLTGNGFSLGLPVFRVEKTGANGGVTFMDDITHLNFRIFHNNGKLNMANRTLHLYQVSTETSGARSHDISNATITLEHEWAANASNNTWVNNAAGSFIFTKHRFITNGLTYPKVHCGAVGNNVSIVNANIQELLFTGTDLLPNTVALGGNNTIGTLEFKGAAEIRGNNTIGTLLLAPSRNYTFRNTQTITGLLRFNNPDCSGLGEMRGLEGVATLNFGPASTKEIQNVLLENMAATGTGVPVAVSGADAGGNSGFNISASAGGARYWVGGSGDWNDASHWSLTSGGAGGACVPTVANDVFFDANSFTSGSSTVTIANGNAYSRSMNWTGAGNAPTLNMTSGLKFEVWGDIIMSPTVTLNASFSMLGSANSVLTTNGNTLGTWAITFNKPAGTTLKVTDNFVNPRSSITVSSGNLDMSGRTITLSLISDANTASATSFNVSNATLDAGWNYAGANKNLQAAGSVFTSNYFRAIGGTYNKVTITTASNDREYLANTTIDQLVFSVASTASEASVGPGNTINQLEFKGRGVILGTGNNIGTLIFAPGMTYIFGTGTNTTITTNWFGSGSPCNPTQIISSGATPATVTKTSGTVDFDYVRLSGITAAGVTPFIAREHSTDLGNNTNWQIEPYNNTTTITGLGADFTKCAAEFPVTLSTAGFFAAPSATYLWNDGSTANSLAITEGGTYSVTVRYPDGCNISDNITVTKSTVTVEPITGGNAVCDGATINLTSTTAGGTWATTDATIATVSNAGLVTGIAPGTAAISYTVSNAEGCSTTQTANITVNEVPAVNDITGTLTVFQGSTATLSNTTPGGVWASGNDLVATVSNTGVVSGVAPGTAEISYTVTSPQGCDSTRKVTVTVDGFSPDKRVLSIAKTADAQEPNTNGGFSISLPAGVNAEEAITVTYTVGGTAGATDYTPLSGTATIAAGQNSVPLAIVVADDGLIENTETVIVTLSAATGATYTYTLSSTENTASADILDDDNTPANRVLSVATVGNATEGGAAGRFHVSLPTGIDATEDVTVTYAMSGPAVNGTDYANVTGSVLIPAGSNGADVLINAVDDKIIEGNEGVTLTLTGGTSASTGSFTVSATQGNASLNIVDNDNTAANRTLSVTTAGNASESGTNSSFTISLPADVTATEAITVNYTIGGTATNGEDYTAIAISAVIPAGQNNVVIPVTVTNDGLIELNETVTLTLGSSTSTNFSFPASTTAGNASLTITDNDNTPANRTLTVTKVTDAAEPGTSGSFRISLPTGIKTSQNINVTYSIGAGTATPGTDYTAITGTITIPAGYSDVLVPVTVIDNIVIEPSETVILNISGGNSTNFAFTAAAGGNSATVNIADNDHTANSNIVLLTKVADALEGGENGQYRISLPPGVISSEDVVVTFVLANTTPPIPPGTANPNTDFTLRQLFGGKIVIPAGKNDVVVDVDAGNDGIIEGPETVTLNITEAASASYPFTIDPSGNSAVVTIVDANAASSTPIQVIAGTNIAEPGTHGSFAVKLAGVATSAWPVTIGYRLSGSAVSGQDYESFGTIVIPRNVNTVSVDFRVKDDKIIEGVETMTITLLSGSATDGGGNAFIFPPDPVHESIEMLIGDDDELIPDNLRLSVAKTTDAAEPSSTGTFTVSLPAGYSSSSNIDLHYTMDDGTATRNTDYTVFTTTLQAYQNNVTIPVHVTNDQIIEGTETVIMDLTGGTDGNSHTYGVASGASTATMNLADDDVTPANMMLSITNTGNATEPATNGSYRISLPAGVTCAFPITVNYVTEGTATTGSDYTAFPAAFTIPAGDPGVTVTLDVEDDDLIEKTETVNITLLGGSATGGLNFTAPAGRNSATATITDNDNNPANSTISVTAGVNITEGPSASTSFTIGLTGTVVATEDITVTYTATGTATGGRDYTVLSGTAVIPAGQSNVAVNLSAIDDQYIEGTETVILTLNSATSNSFNWGISTTNGFATLSIADDDNTPANRTLTVTKVTDGTEPGTNGMFRISLPDGVRVPNNITVNYAVGGTATPDADYAALTGTVEIPAGQGSVNVPVTVINDLVIEPTETVVVTIVNGVSSGITFTGAGTATVNIADDERNVPANMTLTVSKTADAAEPTDNGSFSIGLPAGIKLDEDLTVTYTIAGTATAGRDYLALTGTAVIPAGSSDVSVPVTVRDDRFIELNETVEITLTGGRSANFSFAGTGSATVTIADDERATPASLELTVSRNADGAESGTNGAFTISLPTGVSSTEDITVNYTISGTATAGADYTAITGAIVIPAGQSGVPVPVIVTNDQVIEPTETVMMTLAGGTSSSFTFTGTGNAVVNIADDDNTPANLTLTITKDKDAAEPGTVGGANVALPLNITAAEDIRVAYTVTGSATEKDDYVALTGTVVIPAGQNSAYIPVSVIDDKVIEQQESVILTLSGGTSTSFTLTGSGQVTVNIADDDNAPANLVLNVTSSTAAGEPDSHGSFTISLPDGITATENIAVSYIIGGTATADEDYSALTGGAVIPAGFSSVDIAVTVIDDLLIEGTETVTMEVTGGSSPGLSLQPGATKSASLDILDNEADPANLVLNVARTADGTEPGTNGSFVISLPADAVPATPVTVTYTITGNATPGTDYTTLSGTAVIPAGSSSVPVPVTVVNDELIEGPETVTVTLTGASATGITYTIGTSNAATVTIADDDATSLSLEATASQPNAAEPATNGEFTISIAGGKRTLEPVTIAYTISGTATADADYQAITGVITIPAGENSVPVPVRVTDDLLVEDPETVTLTITGGQSAGFTYAAGTAAQATVTITSEDIPVGDLIITKEMVQPLTGPYRLGQDITYRITVRNIGNGIASGVVVTDTLPLQLGLPSNTRADRGDVTVNTDNKIVIWTIGEILPNGSLQLEVRCRIVEGGALEATAEAGSSTMDSDPANNKATMRLQIDGQDMSFPNVFSPNGDGKNERFIIGGVEKYPGAKLQVFNRWGSQVYRSNDYRNDWNGSDLNEGTYFYILEVNKPDGIKTYKGWVLIVR